MKKFSKLFGIIALVAVIGFTMTACDNGSSDSDPVPTAWQGTWVGQGANSGMTIIFTSTTYRFVMGENSSTVGNLVFSAKTNTGSNSANYPNGYDITGTVTAITGSPGKSVGDGITDEYFMHTSGDRLAYGGDPEANYFQKQ